MASWVAAIATLRARFVGILRASPLINGCQHSSEAVHQCKHDLNHRAEINYLDQRSHTHVVKTSEISLKCLNWILDKRISQEEMEISQVAICSSWEQ
jgi:hypothetical protein